MVFKHLIKIKKGEYLAMTDEGILPVRCFFGTNGLETTSWNSVAGFVAGPDETGDLYGVQLDEMEGRVN